MNKQLTVLIPTSPIPSHPSTAILDETIENVRKYTDAQIIVMFDGVHSSLKHRAEDYDKYTHEVMQKIDKGFYGACEGVVHTEHKHQSQMTREVLEYVDTPLIMFCEHDTSPIGHIPFDAICSIVEGHDILNCVRFNIFDRIPKEHEYLMLEEVSVPWKHQAMGPTDRDQNCIRFRRTIQYSQRPNIAKTDWYRMILANHFKADFRGMIEDIMHSVVQVTYSETGEDKFGLAIYTPEGNQLRSYHSDGRGTDEKIIQA